MGNERVVLVTGASRGLGRAIAVGLSGPGRIVAVHHRASAAEAARTVRLVEGRGGRALAFPARLGTRAGARALVRRVERRFGQIDVLVNNVGPIVVKPWDRLSEADWASAWRGVLLSAYFCLEAVLPGMRLRGFGRVVNIGFSRAEHLGSFPTILPYAAAKTALLLLTRTAAVAEKASGITVNLVSPGLLKSGILPRGASIPPSAVAGPESVADAVAFLVSDEAGEVTGSNVIVAGTWKM